MPAAPAERNVAPEAKEVAPTRGGGPKLKQQLDEESMSLFEMLAIAKKSGK